MSNVKYSVKFSYIAVVAMLSIVCSSCGGGSSGGSNSGIPTSSPTQPAPAPTPDPTPMQDPNIERYSRDSYYPQGYGESIRMSFSGFGIEGLKYYSSDGSHGFTENEGRRNYYYSARAGVTTYFHLGSIEFFPVTNHINLSIFHFLRNFNHRSNEVINLTRLLMLLDENNSESEIITLPENVHDLISETELELSDLSIDVNQFENSQKISLLLDNFEGRHLSTAAQAEEYITKYFGRQFNYLGYNQWGTYVNDFDRDGILNEMDSFPWDSTQWVDENNDRKGDFPRVLDFFLNTEGVLAYEVDSPNGFLYVANYNKKIKKYTLDSGQLLSIIEFDDYITSLDVNELNGDLYVGLSSMKNYSSYSDPEDQDGSIALVKAGLDYVDKYLNINAYPLDIKFHKNKYLYVSTEGSGYNNSRLLRIDEELYSNFDILEFHGGSGRIFIGENKLVIVDFSRYSVIDISEYFYFHASGGFDGFHNEPLFILDEYDALVDRHGTGFRMSLIDDETRLGDRGTQYIKFYYYDIRGYMASRKINDIVKDDVTGQYIGMFQNEIVYVNSSTLQLHKTFRSNNYVSDVSGAINHHKYKIAKYNNKIFTIISRRDGTTHVAATEDKCESCGHSEPPVAEIKSVSTGLTVQNEVVLDGSLSFDGEDGKNIYFRWDFNGDGIWDTEFLKESEGIVKYEIPGEKKVIVQVMDSSGLLDEREVVFNLDYGLNYGEEPIAPHIQDVELIVTDARLDDKNNKIYLSSADTGQFFVLNSETGNIERQFNFRYLPTHMDISEDGKTLYLGLMGTGCQLTSVDCTDDLIDINDGIIVKFDTEKQVFFDGFKVDVSPADIKSNGDYLYVSPATLYSTREDFKRSISVYDIDTANKIKDFSAGWPARPEFLNILLIQDMPGFAGCSNHIMEIHRFCDDGVWLFYDELLYGSRNWLLPGTSIAISSTQQILNIDKFTEEGYLQPRAPSDMFIRYISVDSDNNLFAVGYGGTHYDDGGVIRFYDLDSLEFLSEQFRDGSSDWIFTKDNSVIELARHGDYQYKVNIINYPCFSCN